jgi:hypothetical protein
VGHPWLPDIIQQEALQVNHQYDAQSEKKDLSHLRFYLDTASSTVANSSTRR